MNGKTLTNTLRRKSLVFPKPLVSIFLTHKVYNFLPISLFRWVTHSYNTIIPIIDLNISHEKTRKWVVQVRGEGGINKNLISMARWYDQGSNLRVVEHHQLFKTRRV